jgi:hypothetical protein
MSAWGWRFIADTCRRVHVCGWFVIAYKLCAFVGVCVIVVTVHGTDNIKKDVFYYDARLQVLPKMVISPWLLLNMKATDLSKRPEPQRRVFSDVLVCISNAFHAVQVISLLCRLVSCSTRYVQKSVSCHLCPVISDQLQNQLAAYELQKLCWTVELYGQTDWRNLVEGNQLQGMRWKVPRGLHSLIQDTVHSVGFFEL